jgi:hypothetical protein
LVNTSDLPALPISYHQIFSKIYLNAFLNLGLAHLSVFFSTVTRCLGGGKVRGEWGNKGVNHISLFKPKGVFVENFLNRYSSLSSLKLGVLGVTFSKIRTFTS